MKDMCSLSRRAIVVTQSARSLSPVNWWSQPECLASKTSASAASTVVFLKDMLGCRAFMPWYISFRARIGPGLGASQDGTKSGSLAKGMRTSASSWGLPANEAERPFEAISTKMAAWGEDPGGCAWGRDDCAWGTLQAVMLVAVLG
eukprot:13566188-Alexandrium_andersonii.AAC.1